MAYQHTLFKYGITTILTIVFYFTFSKLLFAKPANHEENIPAPLKPWVDWVLNEETIENCPYSYNSHTQYCIWPSKLQLDLSNEGGRFSQQWQIYNKEASVQLPGDKNHWPQNVSSNNKRLTINDINGVPYVTLKKGQHNIKGQFKWSSLPKSLGMTPSLGLLSLNINNKTITNPKFNQQNTLWLSQDKQEAGNEDNLLDIQVFRKISDNHPIQIETVIKLRVSGKQRNIDLSPVLLDNFIPLRITSRLPARMDNEKLTIQLRPGEWQVSIIGRATDNRETFTLPSSNKPWPKEEIWVFANNNTMRQVEITGINSIDPSQTQLPTNWKSLPAYLIQAEQSLQLNTIRRGKSFKNNDKLTLHRQMWLDSNGTGYTIKDKLTGNTELSRLNVINNLKLGSVNIHNEAQLITQLNDSEKVGVEIRHKNIQLVAESRYDESRSTIPVSGWYGNISTISTQLHLPPGWRLFFVNGSDNLPNSWLRQWSLLDLFLVLVIAFACGKLFSKAWGAIALVTLILTWHEVNAPNFIWLALLVTVALVKFVPAGKFKRASQFSFICFQLILALIILPYMIDTIRYSFFPQLENRAIYGQSEKFSQATTALEEVVMSDSISESYESTSRSLGKLSRKTRNKIAKPYQQNLQSLDPNNKIQTGPGLPIWSGRERITLHWSGPIKPEQSNQLILIPPLLTAILRITGILLLLLLSSRFIMSNFQNKPPILPSSSKLDRFYGLQSFFAIGLLFALFTASSIQTAEAKQTSQIIPNFDEATIIPRQDILDELKMRLEKAKSLEAPKCLPYCAQIESMNLAIQNNTMTLRLRAHAAADTMIPLPGNSKTWKPQNVLLNSKTNVQLQRDNKGSLWIMLPKGLHNIVLRGSLSQASSLPLALPLKPHYVSTKINTKKWAIDGINKNGQANQQLQLTRVSKSHNNTADWQANFLPPFVKIDRYLELGLDWQVITTVTRVSNADIPINLNIDLLPNEKPLSDQITIKNGKVNVKLEARKMSTSWVSSLPVSSNIILQASQQDDYLETWRLNANAIWHWKAEGIPISEQQNIQEQSIPIWRPWPNETLQLTLSKPQGIEGQTITVQNSTVQISTGKRAKDFNLSFTALSSRGTQHDITLPENADIQKISIDNIEQSIQQVNNNLALTLKPGKQKVDITWREGTSLNTFYTIPAIDLQLNSVNANTIIKLPHDRWLLWTFGPTMGPAVLFWGIITALFILAFILGRSTFTTLKTWQWALLALGLSQTHPLLILILIAWIIGISLRSKLNTDSLSDKVFNLYQLGFAGLTILAMLILAGSVANGLLGSPSMSVAGNGSNAYFLRWYQDRISSTLPQAGIISLPIWVYRMLMLAWALWLAMSVLRWLQSAWAAFNVGGIWRTSKKASAEEEASKPNPWNGE